MINKAHELNETYQNGLDKNNAHRKMANYVEDIFSQAFKMTEGCKYNLKGRLLAAQRMTDVIMNQLSPVPLAKEALGKYADGYILANPDAIKGRIYSSIYADAEEKRAVDLALEEAKGAYQSMSNDRERVIFEPGTFTEVVKVVQNANEEYYQLQGPQMSAFEAFDIDFGWGADAKISEAQKDAMRREKELEESANKQEPQVFKL